MNRIIRTLAMLLALILAFSAAGCQTTQKKETDPMIQTLTAGLGCGERTAGSILNTITNAGVENITAIEFPHVSGYFLLELKTPQGSYFAILDRGYFLESIREGSPSGKIIYRDMQ